MLAKEVIQRVREIQIRTGRQVADVLAGQYVSVFKGRGIEFDEVRPYIPGDEIRMIDWKVTSRMGSPYVKRFVEERQLTLMLMADISASQDFGSDNDRNGSDGRAVCVARFFRHAQRRQGRLDPVSRRHRAVYSCPKRPKALSASCPGSLDTRIDDCQSKWPACQRQRAVVAIWQTEILVADGAAIDQYRRSHGVPVVSNPSQNSLLRRQRLF